MQQRDFIKEQIEQLGRTLGKIMAGFLGYKTQGTTTVGIEMTNEQLQSELDIDVEKMTGLSTDELKDYLESRNFTDVQIDRLAEYFFEVGQSKSNPVNAVKYYETSMCLINLAASYSSTLTFERMGLRRKVEGVLLDS